MTCSSSLRAGWCLGTINSTTVFDGLKNLVFIAIIAWIKLFASMDDFEIKPEVFDTNDEDYEESIVPDEDLVAVTVEHFTTDTDTVLGKSLE